MRSKPVVIVFAILSGVMLLVCLPMGLRFWRVFRTRRAFAAAVAHYNDGRYPEALKALDLCARYMPDRVVVYRLAGYACTQLADPDYGRARGYYETMLKYAKGEDAAEAHVALGGLYLRRDAEGQRDLDQAIEHLKAALDGDDDLADAHGALGIAYALKGLPKTADAHLERAWQAYADGETVGAGASARLWQIASMYRTGELVEASRAFDELCGAAPDVPRAKYQAALALARAFRANEDGLSSSIRAYYLQGTGLVPAELRKKHGLRIHTLAAAACDRLGKPDQALDYYRQAHGAAADNAMARRNLAHALFQAAQSQKDEAERKKLLDESLALYRLLLKDGQLEGDERKQVSLALASLAWNAGKKAEAQAIIQSIGSSDSALTARMEAAAAIRAKDYRKAVAHLEAALKADPKQPDVAALVARLKAPPEIRKFRVNTRNPYDRRPMISVAFLPRALPEPIPPANVRLTLDGRNVQPLFAKAECFFVPANDLEPGEHKMELTVTDTLGLAATRALSFSIQQDKEPPTVVGIAPAPDSTAASETPVIAFRATDPSGIDLSSMSAVLARGSGPSLAIIAKGRYAIGFKKGEIDKGDPVKLGAARFQFTRPLKHGEYTLRVGVSDTRGNRCIKRWSFKVE